jgi:hypothetical protein
MNNCWRTLMCVIVGSGLVLRVAAGHGPEVEQFFARHCLDCHSGVSPEGGLDIARLSDDLADPVAFGRLVKIHDRIAAGEMPPPDAPAPEPGERAAVLARLDDALVKTDRLRIARDGRAGVRRMSRSEYQNTLRDLLAMPHLDILELLPPDGRVAGYDKVANGQSLSPIHMAAYTAAAEAAVAAAIATRSTPPPVAKRRIYPASVWRMQYNLVQGTYVLLDGPRPDPALPFTKPDGPPRNPFGTEPISIYRNDRFELIAEHKIHESQSSVGMLMANVGALFGTLEASPIHAGPYRIRVSLWGFQWNAGKVEPVAIPQAAALRAHRETRENREGRHLATISAASLTPRETEITAWLDEQEVLVVDPVSIPWFGSTLSISVDGRFATSAHVGAGVALDWVDVEGPLYESWPPESHRSLFGNLPIKPLAADGTVIRPARRPVERQSAYWPKFTDLPPAEQQPPLETVQSADPIADARRLLGMFLGRAFRRPVIGDEIEPYVRLVEQRLAANECFEDAMRRAYVAILTSAPFLFHASDAMPDQTALASRLAYWLWNSSPDEPLLAAAASGRLNDPAAVKAHVERLLADPRSGRFVDDFADQWLELRRLDETMPDRDLYPEYSILLHEGMAAEPRAFIREAIDKDLPIAALVEPGFAMLTQRLAEHYGIPGVEGAEVRRVPVPPESPRGGLLGQAAIHKLTANGTTTSPVKRGVWVMDRLLAEPPPPPPANVMAIEPDTRGTTTVREQLSRHRDVAACAGCHAKIDPPGFALESFDPVGGFRERYRAIGKGDDPPERALVVWPVAYRIGPAVDASGKLSDGCEFDGLKGLTRHLAADPRRLARGLVHHLACYATGAEIGYADRRIVDAILDSAAPSHYGLRSLIQAVAASELVAPR